MTRIRILYDAGPAMDNKKTGVGYYVDRLAESIQENYDKEVQLIGYYFNFLNRKKFISKPGIILNKVWLVPGKFLGLCRKFGFQPLLQLIVPRSYDAVIFTNYVSLPQFPKRKTLLVIYDLCFIDHPEFIQDKNLNFLQHYCPPSIRKADIIITISEFTKQRIVKLFPGIKAKIIVTPIPPEAKKTIKIDLPRRLTAMGILKGGYILYVGTIEPRKNLQALMKAYAKLSEELQKNYSLVLAGGKGWHDEDIIKEIKSMQNNGINIIMTGYISDEEKSALYKNAAAFVLPSHYEGFGMTILEAMQYEVPLAVSDIPVFHEVAGNAALYFNKDNTDDISKKLSNLLTKNNLRMKLKKESRKQLGSFSWKRNADKVYEEII